jgi:hypothetical protein
MNSINWQTFCDDYGIEYSPENSRGFTSCVCPYCGSNKKHLGLHSSGYAVCFICGYHHIQEVVKILTGENWYTLQIKYKDSLSPRDIFLLEHADQTERAKRIIFPERLVPLTDRARKYLIGRNFDPNMIAEKYGVKSTTENGPHCHRLYIPVRFENREISWTTRDITNRAEQRYLSCPERDEVLPHKSIVYSFDDVPGDHAILVEGVTDCWRLGNGSVCCFGIKYSQSQANLLATFRKVSIIFDDEINAQIQANKLGDILSGLGVDVEIIKLGNGDDPGSMSQVDADSLVKDLLGD